MRHLTTEQLVDLAEGLASGSAAAHVRSCAGCQRRVDDLRGAIAVAADVEMPAPSPLFWEHFSVRVHDAVRRDRAVDTSPSGEGRSGAFAQLTNWMQTQPAAVVASAIAVAAAALVLAGTGLRDTPRQFEPVSAAFEAPSESAFAADDPSLSLVADLAADLDWDSARDAGLTSHVGVDDVLSQLTSGERRELRRLLQGELSTTRRGA
jgi:hypothetical protein